MEGISVRMYDRLRRYYRTKMGYERLDGSGRRRTSTVQLGPSKGSRRIRVWRFKMKTKIQVLRKVSPKRLLMWLRDAYVKMMLNLASSTAMSAPVAGNSNTNNRLAGRLIKDYDEKMLVEIYYKSLFMSQGQLVPREASKLGSESFCRLH